MFRVTLGCIALSLVFLTGCSKKASVTGKVTFGGTAVKGGSLVFAPVGGGAPPATVAIASDGGFNASGVQPGKNKVIYNAPPAEFPAGYTPKPSEPAPMSPYTGMVVKTPEVEVGSGSTPMEIELVPPMR